MSGFQVGVTALAGPAQRLKQIAKDLGTAGTGASTAAGNGSAAAGTATVSAAADVFRAGVQSVLAALGDDAGLLGDKVQKAGVTYQAVDRTAMPGGGPGGGSGGGPSPPVPVAAGDSLWTLAAKRLGPGASNAAVTAEVSRWYAANRDAIGADPSTLRPGTKLRVPAAPAD